MEAAGGHELTTTVTLSRNVSDRTNRKEASAQKGANKQAEVK